MSGNSITLVGNMTDDAELKFTASGQPQARFSLAVNRRWQDRNSGQWQEDVSFFNCTAWRDLAENVAESLKKGTRVIVHGRLQQRRWETENGEKRSIIEVTVDEVGPSLRWATASVERNARKEEGAGDGSPGGGSGSGTGTGGSWDPPVTDDF